MKESTFWTNRVRGLVRLSAACADMVIHAERVENAVAVGTPDVDYCINGRHGKIELKYAPRHPVRPSTPVLGLGKGLRKSQIVWATRRKRAGGRVYLCIGTVAATWFIDLSLLTPRQMKDTEMMTVAELDSIAAWRSGQPHEQLGRILFNT